MKFYAGIDGGLHLNSFASMLKDNPYIVSDQQLKPTETKYKVYGGFRGDLDEMIKYDVAVAYSKMNNILFYKANDLFNPEIATTRAAYDYANTFSAMYDSGNVTAATVSLQYFPLENLSFDGGLQYHNYQLENHDDIYNIPVFTGQIGAQYTLLNKKLLLGFKAILDSGVTENFYDITDDGLSANYTSTENQYVKSTGDIDLNLSAEYKVHKNFSIFALGNNLTGEKYDFYKGYKVLGAQIMGGVKISF